MKKIILILAAVVMSAGIMSAQDMSEATEAAKNANEELVSKNYPAALAGFKDALAKAQACGEEGEEIVNTCKGIIPTIIVNIAKGEIRESKIDEGLATLQEAIATATEYGADDVVAEATNLISQAKKTKATNLYKAKDYAGAIEAFKDVLASNPTDGSSLLQMGAAQNASGDKDGAIESFKAALENGQAAAAKQLANIYLKDAQALLKEKKYKEAIAACELSNEYNESANAYKIAGGAAAQAKDNAAAIKNYEKYLELSPEAKDANAITFTVAALYQQSGNKAKAKEYYTKIQGDATYGAQAKQQLDALK